MIAAKIIADSKNQFGNRITTFVLTFPRIVLAEFNTHRMISKNSASSRAIPFKKMVKMVQENPFIPIKWMKEHSGMQGTEYFTDQEVSDLWLVEDWLTDRDEAVTRAERRHAKGVSKQICNRKLEEYMYHTVIATATDWQNFFALRANDQAEIHIQNLAYKMLDAYNASEPKQLRAGEWHIPFGDDFEYYRVVELFGENDHRTLGEELRLVEEYKVKIATARCARVSYLNFEGKDDYLADLELYNRLLTSGHYSPFEHCAKAMNIAEHYAWRNGYLTNTSQEAIEKSAGYCGNFRGFIQLRKTLQGENKIDNRVITK